MKIKVSPSHTLRMSTHNKYTCLDEPDHETNEYKRKYKKKIREINILKKKPVKTSEELDKISKEDEYIES